MSGIDFLHIQHSGPSGQSFTLVEEYSGELSISDETSHTFDELDEEGIWEIEWFVIKDEQGIYSYYFTSDLYDIEISDQSVIYSLELSNTTLNDEQLEQADLNNDNVIDENKIIQQSSEQEEVKKEPIIDPAFENISMENAAYLQNTENVFDDQDYKKNENTLKYVCPDYPI